MLTNYNLEEWAAIKSQSPSLTHGFISFKKILKKAIEGIDERRVDSRWANYTHASSEGNLIAIIYIWNELFLLKN